MVSEKIIRKNNAKFIFNCLGSADAGMTVHKDSYSLSAKMKLLGQRLNLRPHLVGAGGDQHVHCSRYRGYISKFALIRESSYAFLGHIGEDDRQYILVAILTLY